MSAFSPTREHADVTNIIASYSSGLSLTCLGYLVPGINRERYELIRDTRMEEVAVWLAEKIMPPKYIDHTDIISKLLTDMKIPIHEAYLIIDWLLARGNPSGLQIYLYWQLLIIQLRNGTWQVTTSEYIKITRRYIEILKYPQYESDVAIRNIGEKVMTYIYRKFTSLEIDDLLQKATVEEYIPLSLSMIRDIKKYPRHKIIIDLYKSETWPDISPSTQNLIETYIQYMGE